MRRFSVTNDTNTCCQRHGLSHLPRLLTRWRHRLPHLHHECWLLIGLLEIVRTNHSHVGPDLKTLGLECLQLSVQFVPLLLHILALLLQGGLHPVHLVLLAADVSVLVLPVLLPLPPLPGQLLLQVPQLLQLLIVFVATISQSSSLLALSQLNLY